LLSSTSVERPSLASRTYNHVLRSQYRWLRSKYLCTCTEKTANPTRLDTITTETLDQHPYLDTKVRRPWDDLPSSKRVNSCAHAHTYALPRTLPRATYQLSTRYLPDLRHRRHFPAREKCSVDTDRFEGIAHSSGMSSGTLEPSGSGDA
jgi:hypothetical protein